MVADSPAWAAQLRLHHRRILTALEQLRPGTVQAIDVRVGPAPTRQDQDPHGQPVPRPTPQPPTAPARNPLADHTAYQELRHRLRENAAARQAALDEAAAQREAILRRHYNRLPEPENTNRSSAEDNHLRTAAETRARQQRERQQAALAVARAHRAGAIPLRPTGTALPRAGAA